MEQPARPSHYKALATQIRKDLSIGAPRITLPRRVLSAIAVRTDASEVLIKLIQLVIVVMFGILYALAPRTDAGTAFSPVPFVLGAYFLATLFGLGWALRARIPDWAVYFSIVLDMALLMSMILSFHIQYQQPASFVLKAPAMLYVFIFIALRALRFEPRFVFVAGITAALGWAAMIWYVVNIDPDDAMITRSYVDYLTGNAILLGAEFDKIISILTVTCILALALRRGRELVVDAVREAKAARDLSRFFDKNVASHIKGADRRIQAGEGVKRMAAVLNADIRGFTPLAAGMEPSDIMKLLADYHARIVPILQGNHGTIDKFLGDGIMATFGAVAESDSFACDALRAVDEIIAATDAWAEERIAAGLDPVTINISVASGPLAFGAVGGKGRLEYTVIGAAVNLSAKLEKHNKELSARAVASGECLALAREQGYMARDDYRVSEAEVAGVSGIQSVVVLYDRET